MVSGATDRQEIWHLSQVHFLTYFLKTNHLPKTSQFATFFITKTETANQLVLEAGVTASADSEKFVSETLAQCPQIYPIYNGLPTGAQALLPYAFIMDSHGRHMLYTEGGNNMFEYLRALIKKGLSDPNFRPLAEALYKLWFSRWIVNIAGFRGHVDDRGSLGLSICRLQKNKKSMRKVMSNSEII